MKTTIQRYLKTKWPAILWSVIIFLLLTLPPITIGPEKKLEIVQLDKIVHAFLFAVLVILSGYYVQTKQAPFQQFLLRLLAIAVIATLYGILMEFVQLYTGRDFDIWDMVADGTGAFLAWLVMVLKNRPR